MNSEIFEWFNTLAERSWQRNRIFLHIPSQNISISYHDFFNKVNLQSNSIPKDADTTIALDFRLETLIDFFIKLSRGNNITVIHPNRTQFWSPSKPKTNTEAQEIKILSSGSGGEPKLYIHDLSTLVWNLEEYLVNLEVDETNCIWSAFPPSSISGIKSLFIAVKSGGSIIWEPFPSGPELLNFGDQLRSKPMVNALAFAPNMAEAIILAAQRNNFYLPAQLRRLVCGGDILLGETVKNFENIFKRIPGILYGLTETAGPISYCSPQEWKPNSLGKILRGSFKIDEVTKRLKISGGFLAKNVSGPWFETNDLVTSNNENEIFFVSRNLEWINWAGEKISLIEIENFLKKQDGVVDALVYKKNELLCSKIFTLNSQTNLLLQKIVEVWPKNFPLPTIEFVNSAFVNSSAKKIRFYEEKLKI